LARVGATALAVGVALGLAGNASAAPPHHTTGHGNAHYGHGNAHYAHSGYAGGHHYYGGQNYYRPGYGGYAYGYPRSSFNLGINIGGLGFGYGYPRYYGYGYGYGYPAYAANGYPAYSTYAVPSYSTYEVPTTSYYPPTETAPAPVATNSARLTIEVPADARLWIDGQLSNQTGPVRTYETPATLEPGRAYSYRLVAEWVENGQTVSRERTVQFAAGNQLLVNLTVS